MIYFWFMGIMLIILYVWWSIISIKDIIEWLKDSWEGICYFELEGYTVYWIVFTTFVGLILLGKVIA